MSSTQENIARQVAALSSGTLASLTGLRSYAELDKVHAAFFDFATTGSVIYRNWQDAWRSFQATTAPALKG